MTPLGASKFSERKGVTRATPSAKTMHYLPIVDSITLVLGIFAIKEAHNPEQFGAAEDRVIRAESYVKDFKPLNIGTIHLQKGKGTLTLKAVKKTGEMMMDFRLMLFKRI